MRTKQETLEFLNSLRWKRMTKNELQTCLQEFFCTTNEIEESTDNECKDVDYSLCFTNAESFSTTNIIDIEIWYLKMRKKNHILITGTELLTYLNYKDITIYPHAFKSYEKAFMNNMKNLSL